MSALDGLGLACNDTVVIGKPNGAEHRIYLRSAASNPKALLTAAYTTIKNAGALRGSYRLAEQPKLWVRLFKIAPMRAAEIRITILKKHHIGNDDFFKNQLSYFSENLLSDLRYFSSKADLLY